MAPPKTPSPLSPDKFQCENCKKTLDLAKRAKLSLFTKKLLFYTLNKVLPAFNKTEEICQSCVRQMYVWFIFLVLVIVAAPHLDALRSGS